MAGKRIVSCQRDAHEVLSGGLAGVSQEDSRMREEYLTVEELSRRIRFSKQTLYNMISSKKFVRGQHYVKPSRKKVLFLWSAIRGWLEDQNSAMTNARMRKKASLSLRTALYTFKSSPHSSHAALRLLS